MKQIKKIITSGGSMPKFMSNDELIAQTLQNSYSTHYTDSALDVQHGGDHYKDMPIQVVEFNFANNLDYFQGNIIKYVCRYKKKNGKEDLLKARHYLDMYIEFLYGTKNQRSTGSR